MLSNSLVLPASRRQHEHVRPALCKALEESAAPARGAALQYDRGHSRDCEEWSQRDRKLTIIFFEFGWDLLCMHCMQFGQPLRTCVRGAR